MIPSHPILARRDVLQAGMLGLLGLGMDGLARLQKAASAPPASPGYPRARSVVLVFLHGGLSQLDSFDLKPDAPAEIRGEFSPIDTGVPGIQVCEHLPSLARISHLWSLCRSLTHLENAHGPACHAVLTGRTKLPLGAPGGCGAPPTPADWPSIASHVTHALVERQSYSLGLTRNGAEPERGSAKQVASAASLGPTPGLGVDAALDRRNNLPPAIVFPAGHPTLGFRPGQGAGRLGVEWDPWFIEPCSSTSYGCLPDAFTWASSPVKGEYVVPYRPEREDFFRTPSLSLPQGLGEDRFAGRLQLLAEVERQRRQLDALAERGHFDSERERAVSLLTGPESARALFDVTRAGDQEQARYGRNEWGWLLLLTRRLVEAGVPLVQVTLDRNGGWDTHRDNFRLLKDYLFPPFDRALAAFLEDLHERRLLEETLVVVMGEFGRAPYIVRHEQGRSMPGRDHWARVQTVLLAGGGIQGGRVIGASDKVGGEPARDAQTPENLGATIYHALGIPREAAWYAREDAQIKANPQPVYQGEPTPGLV